MRGAVAAPPIGHVPNRWSVGLTDAPAPLSGASPRTEATLLEQGFTVGQLGRGQATRRCSG
jgi:hypothetical protein